MKTRTFACLTFGCLMAVALAFVGLEPRANRAAADDTKTAAPAAPAVADDKDREAIVGSSADYGVAFGRGDAKAAAAMWMENGEFRDGNGTIHLGRAAIEKAHAEFFKANPATKVELLVKKVRFPAKDLAVEEGLVRSSTGTKIMPRTVSYVAIHVREGRGWKIALCSESPAAEDRLEDLDWVLGSWTTKTRDGGEAKLTFRKDADKPLIHGTFTKTVGKETFTGTIRVQLDPETGGIRSWGFEDDGAHSQGLWHNDGKSWLIETRGVRANGAATSETIVLQRVAADAISWHAIDRVFDGESLPDTPPLRLTRSDKK